VQVDVVIPLAGTCQHRADAFTYILDSLRRAAPHWGVLVGYGDPDRWSKAEAVANALERSTADVIVVHDADVWCSETVVAVAEGLTRASWAVPHEKVYRLTREATAEVLSGRVPLYGPRPASGTPSGRYERVHRGFPGGGIVALRRDLYDRIPLDPRFVGWGHEDESWAWALKMLAGKPWRGDARLWHLWHPPQPRNEKNQQGSPESWALRTRYRRAVTSRDRTAMEALLAEV
jgi:hypothetical protein